jgi:Domain of unknown function (DUF4265)
MPNHVHVRIPVWNDDGSWVGPEEVAAKEIESGRFIIECPPRLAYGLAVGDEIELVDSAVGFRVIKHSGNLTVWIFAPNQEAVAQLVQQLMTKLQTLKGVLEGTPGEMLIVTIPLAAGWTNIRDVLDSLVETVSGSTWMYANVYEIQDGDTPLNWWLHPENELGK